MYRTCHSNRLLYFNVILDASCKFSTRRNDIYDPSARIIDNLLNSTIFWTRHLNSATRPLNSATRQILHIVAYFGEASSQRIGYEPAGLTVHPPPRMIEGGFIFFVWVSSATKIFSSKKKWIL